MKWVDPVEAAIHLERVRAWMAEAGAPALVVRRLANVAWLTGGCDRAVSWAAELSAVTIVVTRSVCAVITPDYEYDRIVSEDLAGLDWPMLPYPWEDEGAYARHIRQLCEGEEPWSDSGGARAPAVESALRDLRIVLSAREIERYIRLGKDTADIVQACGFDVQSGQRERDIARDLTMALLERDIMPATVLVGADERGRSVRHPLPTDTQVQRMALLAVAVRRGGLWVSCTRMVSFGSLTHDERRAHQTVLAADAAYIEGSATQPTLGGVFRQGMAVYQARGYANGYRQHHQGGITGYAAREARATADAPQRLQAPMAFAWNPWLEGMKSEDTIITRPSAAPLIITAAPGWPQMPLRTPLSSVSERPAILER